MLHDVAPLSDGLQSSLPAAERGQPLQGTPSRVRKNLLVIRVAQNSVAGTWQLFRLVFSIRTLQITQRSSAIIVLMWTSTSAVLMQERAQEEAAAKAPP